MTTNSDPSDVRSAYPFPGQMRREGFLASASTPNWLSPSSRIPSVDPIIEKCPEVITRHCKKLAAVANKAQKTHRAAVEPLTRQRCDEDVLLGFRRRCSSAEPDQLGKFRAIGASQSQESSSGASMDSMSRPSGEFGSTLFKSFASAKYSGPSLFSNSVT